MLAELLVRDVQLSEGCRTNSPCPPLEPDTENPPSLDGRQSVFFKSSAL